MSYPACSTAQSWLIFASLFFPFWLYRLLVNDQWSSLHISCHRKQQSSADIILVPEISAGFLLTQPWLLLVFASVSNMKGCYQVTPPSQQLPCHPFQDDHHRWLFASSLNVTIFLRKVTFRIIHCKLFWPQN